jgi:hypothetical protein
MSDRLFTRAEILAGLPGPAVQLSGGLLRLAGLVQARRGGGGRPGSPYLWPF